ncbi:oligopeptidase A [Pseudomonas citronellolis]|uniref:oligopeptidase A n=2 Tax=Pseudomonas TaxID=286 RepID=A0A1A9K6A0_9PSED|nr:MULTISPECIES: oligopeptidase A [Pseudomonas]NTX92031.1 oligopeptidase A [Pseudomonas sp. UMA643]NTY17118.1 oligopeptidase A [Pseudomonas sp. UMC3103]NTY25671.1 oligopeptidase A [Pseudomonas sp. UMA603]NTY29638.1 oligopeptidase A [Pseudomonas sp. UMC3129]NTY56398.1 oligopeptidase A [Pseudomonas sp. UMC631]NTY64757.1 oligopeptidase A [Pseudomonas sp. UMC3106]NUA32371.1 oligopeptidase A [Pseudomonas sp. UMA601]
MSANPLLQSYDLPPFSAIRPEHVKPAIEQILADNRAGIARILAEQGANPSWDGLVLAMDELHARLGAAWSPVSHLNAVCNSAELREAYEGCLPLLSAYWTELGQNRELFKAYEALAASPAAANFDVAQKTILEHALRDFRLSGIDLPAEQQKRYAEIQARLSELGSRFSNQLLDATQAWTKHVTDEAALAGLTDSAKAQMQQAAQAKGLDGWLISLEFPSYFAVMTYADDRALREEVYAAYCTRASDQGPNAGQNDNGPVMQEILDLRQELARLLGYANFSALSLATKMAESPEQVLHFLRDLAVRSKPYAQQDLDQLKAYAAEQGCAQLQSWDSGYYGEKLREARYSVSQEALRAYFPVDKVLSGLFAIVQKLYGIQIRELHDFERWHPDVRLFEIEENGQHVGRFYFDLYARANKRGGAWMDGARDRRRDAAGQLIAPVAYLVCNFTPAVNGKPALLTHDEVTTLFHEFGHGLHHLLTRVEHAGASGINGVAWDAVELPSQFMENWCWEPEGLALISGHYETGAPLPQDILEKMLAAKNFQSGLMMVRQLEFSLFDFELHTSHGDGRSVLDVLNGVRDEVAVMRPPAYNRFANSFAHIFAGGYAAGYYSYKWAEVLSADAFSRFEEEGVFNPQTGAAFREAILAKGGSQEPMALFVAFRGREPSIDALLRHSGLTGEAA